MGHQPTHNFLSMKEASDKESCKRNLKPLYVFIIKKIQVDSERENMGVIRQGEHYQLL